MSKPKVLLIGWDAADWDVINPLMESGQMPALKKLVEGGMSGKLATLEPVFSPMLWSSIATGKLADKHGVLGFTEPDYSSGAVRPVSNHSRKTAAIWNILSHQKLKTNVVGWWPSHPAEPVNGAMVSNFYQKASRSHGENWPMAPGTVFPKKYQQIMKDLRVHPGDLTDEHILPFVPLASQVNQEEDKRLNSVGKILAEAASIHNAGTWLLEHTEWDFMAIYYDNIDHFCHGFMKFHPPQIKGLDDKKFELYKEVVNSAYKFHDMMLGRILDLVDDNTTIMLISDHGFESGINRLLSLPKEAAAPAYDHRAYGVFAAMGPEIKKDELVFGATLLDIAPTLLSLFNLPQGKDMDGKPLLNIFNTKKEVKYINSWDDLIVREVEEKLDPASSKEALEMLINLGYIEKPDDKAEVALEKARVENEFNLARVYLSSNRPKEAISLLETLFKTENSVRFGLRLIIAYEALKKYDAALEIIDTLEKAIKNPIQQLNALKASLLAEKNEKEAALEIVNLAYQQRIDTPFSAQRFAKVLIKYKHFKRADAFINRVLKRFPENSSLLYLSGVSTFGVKAYEKAVELFLESINSQFFNPTAHFYLGECLSKLDLLEDAYRAFSISLKQKPKSRKVMQRLSNLELKGVKVKFSEAEFVNYNSKNLENATLKKQVKKEFLKNLEGTIYIVSGLPRSGTSMMMQLLNAGGADIFTDGKRKADNSNPKGYLEHEGIKQLARNRQLLADAKDKVVKVVAPQLKFLMPKFKYKVIFMDRKVEEVVASQHKMSGKIRAITLIN
ncbi:MAG: alkaline phosphatase family protein [Vicingaceae bacterium]